MKHLKYAEKTLLVGDDAADLLTEYAAALAREHSADTVTLKGFGADSDDVEATFVLDSGTILMSESTHTSIPEPDNTEAVDYMRQRLRELTEPNTVEPLEEMPDTDEVDRMMREL
jgi:hypothetical protein